MTTPNFDTMMTAPTEPAPTAHELLVAAEVRVLRVKAEARQIVAAERAGTVPPFDAGLLGDVLARPAEPAHRVEGLIPADAGTLVVAQRKTGKTTLLLNLARTLLLGGDFLGRFPVIPVTGRVAFLNFEVSAAQLARWAQECGVPADRLVLVNLRGRRNPLGNAEDRDHLAELLRSHEVESVIVDPFGRAFHGASQNDSGEVGAWLADLDRWARGEVGARDVILTAHAGWDGERTRGASALEDWADSIVTLVRDKDDDQVRYLRAEGRDVLVDEDRLDFDPFTRTLSLAGAGSRKAASKARSVDELVPAVVAAVTASPGITGYGLLDRLRAAGTAVRTGEQNKAAALAVERGLLTVENGPRNSRIYRPTPHLSHLSPPIPGNAPPPVPPVYKGQVEVDRSTTTKDRDRSSTETDCPIHGTPTFEGQCGRCSIQEVSA